MIGPRALGLAVGLALVAAACGGGESTADRAVNATSIEGEDVVLAEYAGQDVMLWFWAPW